MKIVRVACVILSCAFSATAFANELPVQHGNWTGFYAGIAGGGGRASDTIKSFTVLSTQRFHGSGGIAGGTLGYNFQRGPLLFGIEGDASWADIDPVGKDAAVFPYCTNLGIGRCGTKLGFLGTVRGRFGFLLWDRILLYGTGGVAFGRLKGSVAFTGNATSGSGTNTGWAAGGGIEARTGGNWSVKIEYLHLDLGDGPTFPHDPFSGITLRSANWTADIGRVGLNYHF